MPFRPGPRNGLLRTMSPEDFGLLEPHLRRVDLPRGKFLHRPHEEMASIHFPDAGIASVVCVLEGGRMIEAGVVGREGMVGLPVVLGVEATPTECFMQVPGSGWRVDAAVLREAMGRRPSLRDLLLRYAMAFLDQVTQTAACNGAHSVRQRLARWLLMSHDRCDGDRIPLTQEAIASMLGVRRAGVTVAAGALQKAGAIAYAKGEIAVLDRGALEATACECHSIVRDRFDRLLPGDEPA